MGSGSSWLFKATIVVINLQRRWAKVLAGSHTSSAFLYFLHLADLFPEEILANRADLTPVNLRDNLPLNRNRLQLKVSW